VVAVRKHAPFREPRGPRRVHDRDGVGGGESGVGLRVVGLRELAGVQEMSQLGKTPAYGLDRRHSFGIADHNGGCGVVQLVAEEVALEEHVDRDVDRPQPRAREYQIDVLDAVGKDRRDTIAFRHAERCEP
jgi:hypothetical protein